MDPRFPDRLGPEIEVTEVDLDTQHVEFQGQRLTEQRADEVANETLAELRRRNLIPGRKSLTGGSTHSPRVQFRVPETIREKAEQRARDEHVSLSVLARRALEQYLGESTQ